LFGCHEVLTPRSAWPQERGARSESDPSPTGVIKNRPAHVTDAQSDDINAANENGISSKHNLMATEKPSRTGCLKSGRTSLGERGGLRERSRHSQEVCQVKRAGAAARPAGGNELVAG
jgi:hypothetical protein